MHLLGYIAAAFPAIEKALDDNMEQGDEKNDRHDDGKLIVNKIVHHLDTRCFGGQNRVTGTGAEFNRTGTGDNGGDGGTAAAKAGE
ncbi:hypothetical protein D3C73_1363130 [compost metagenome]